MIFKLYTYFINNKFNLYFSYRTKKSLNMQ